MSLRLGGWRGWGIGGYTARVGVGPAVHGSSTRRCTRLLPFLLLPRLLFLRLDSLLLFPNRIFQLYRRTDIYDFYRFKIVESIWGMGKQKPKGI